MSRRFWRWAIGLAALAACSEQAATRPARPTVTPPPQSRLELTATARAEALTDTPPVPAPPADQSPPANQPEGTPAAPAGPPEIISTDAASPDGLYVVRYADQYEYPEIAVLTADGAVITAQLRQDNYDVIDYDRLPCQCATKIGGWVGPHTFLLRINTGTGESFGFLVDAATGKVDGDSFMRLPWSN